MVKISQDVIERIRDSVDILDIISEYVDLRRRGKNFFGLCPFHTEKTPSFSVAQDKQIYHCFGCGNGGNVITFVMEYEKINFVEALKKLGNRVGITIEFGEGDEKKEFITQLYKLHSIAVHLYSENLFSSNGKTVLDYLFERGLSDETLKKFHIGYATTKWNQLYSIVTSKNFPEDVIGKSGLFSKGEKGYFDRFRDRIIFPITNRAGRFVALGGRDVGGKSDAKYLNSPETPIYNKSRILYGLSITHKAIRQKKSLIVVEGYMDLLQLYQNGIQNLVATAGTALTEGHVREIRKLTDTVILAYDGDEAGRKAVIRAGYNLLKGGLTPEIVEVPEDHDPDSWIRALGTETVNLGIKNAIGLIEFHLKHTELDLSKPAHRSQLASEILDEIVLIRDEIIRQFTVKQVAELLNIEDQILIRMLSNKARWMKKRRGDQLQISEESKLQTSYEKAQRELISLLAGEDSDVITFIKKHINLDHFSHPVLKTLTEHLIHIGGQPKPTDLASAIDRFEKKSDRDMAAQFLIETSTTEDPKQVAIDCLITLEKTPLKQKISEQRILLREMEKSGEDTSVPLLEVVKLQAALKSLEKKRNEWIDQFKNIRLTN